MEAKNCMCQVRRVCYCGQELETWYDDTMWYEGCKKCNAIYTYGLLPVVWRKIYGDW